VTGEADGLSTRGLVGCTADGRAGDGGRARQRLNTSFSYEPSLPTPTRRSTTKRAGGAGRR